MRTTLNEALKHGGAGLRKAAEGRLRMEPPHAERRSGEPQTDEEKRAFILQLAGRDSPCSGGFEASYAEVIKRVFPWH
jgi:hypothetical protein